MTPEEKKLCVKEGVPPAAVHVLAGQLSCSIEDAIQRYIAKKRAEKNIQRLIAEERELRLKVKNLEIEVNAPQTVADVKKLNRNLSVQNDILFNIYGRVMEAIETKGITDEERVDKIRDLVTNSLIAVNEIGMTNPKAIEGGE